MADAINTVPGFAILITSPEPGPRGDRVWSYADLERVSAKAPAGFRTRSGELKGRPLDLIQRSEARGMLQ